MRVILRFRSILVFMINWMKIFVFFVFLGGLFVVVGGVIGGSGGFVLGLGLGFVIVGSVYWFSDKVVIVFVRVKPVDLL